LVDSDVVEKNDFAALGKFFDAYASEYQAYFKRNCAEKHVNPVMLDTLPRVVLIPGIGILTAGATAKDASIAMDIYRHTATVILNGEQLGSFRALPEGDIFDVEYWVLEQAKLKLGSSRLPLSSKVAVVTGGASGIGLSISREFLEQGAQVFALDINSEKFETLRKEIVPPKKGGNQFHFLKTDVTDRNSVANSMAEIVEKSGGIDVLVVNAGIFPPSSLLEEIDLKDWQKSLDVNVNGAFHTVAEGLRWMKRQGQGGDIIFIASKNVPAPGKEAGAYSVSKAAQNQLARISALEGGAHGIRVNVLHPHLIFDTGIWSDEVIEKRAKAYNLSPEAYRKNNLLKTELSSKDVARAAFALAAGYFSKTTGAQIPLDGGSDRTL
jgi:NAD(P)-dependent dehydrogenase (short-subunit alcohol dehydrogenase family)